jgi:hypothetical protein
MRAEVLEPSILELKGAGHFPPAGITGGAGDTQNSHLSYHADNSL